MACAAAAPSGRERDPDPRRPVRKPDIGPCTDETGALDTAARARGHGARASAMISPPSRTHGPPQQFHSVTARAERRRGPRSLPRPALTVRMRSSAATPSARTVSPRRVTVPGADPRGETASRRLEPRALSDRLPHPISQYERARFPLLTTRASRQTVLAHPYVLPGGPAAQFACHRGRTARRASPSPSPRRPAATSPTHGSSPASVNISTDNTNARTNASLRERLRAVMERDREILERLAR